MHVARRVEEVHAAEARTHRVRAAFGQLVDRQAGGVGGEDGVLAQVRRHLVVQVHFPVHALGDGFDHQVAVFQQVQVVVVVGGLDVGDHVAAGQRRGFQLLETVNSLQRDAVLVAFLGRQVEQNGRYLGVHQVGGDLRPHHAGTEHGNLAYIEFGLRHGFLVLLKHT